MALLFGNLERNHRWTWLFYVAPAVTLFVLLLPTGICSSVPIPAFVATPGPRETRNSVLHHYRSESLLSSLQGTAYDSMDGQGRLFQRARAQRASASRFRLLKTLQLSSNVNGPCGARGLARLAAGAVVLPSAPPSGFEIGIGSSVLSMLHANHWYVWAMLLASSSAGLWSERTQWGAAVSSPLVTMLLTIGLCNAGILPAASPVYAIVNQVFVPLAVPLLLFDADLRKVLRFAGTLLACFVIGAAGTVIGTVAAAVTVPLVGLSSGDGWKIASALAARHIGGAVNYVAVCETLGVSPNAVVAGLAADNMVVSLYFIFLFWITKPDPPKATPSKPNKNASQDDETLVDGENLLLLPMSKETVSYALSAAFGLCLVGDLMSKLAFGGRISAIPLVTLMTVAGATAAPSVVGRLGSVGAQLGVLFMQLFFAVTGAQGSLAVVLGTAPSLLVFSIIQIAVHFGFLVGLGRLVRLPFRELALASNANVGGPTTAAAMAAAKGWKNLVLPALLTGVLGYATATFIGVGMGHALLRSLLSGA